LIPNPHNNWNWDEAAFRLDTEMLTPEERGIYRDILGYLRLHNRSGVITGTREELARAGRCSAVQMDVTLKSLARHRVCNISERNGIITLINRRMKRESSRAGPLSLKKDLASSLEDIPLKLKRGIVKGEPPPRRASGACRQMTPAELEIAGLAESTMKGEWSNDSRKWLNRITGCPERQVIAHPGRVRRVFEEVQNAVKEHRIKTTPARYAEQIWKEFR
jgi:hypothetical protein